jgi:hypothetical protein
MLRKIFIAGIHGRKTSGDNEKLIGIEHCPAKHRQAFCSYHRQQLGELICGNMSQKCGLKSGVNLAGRVTSRLRLYAISQSRRLID